MSLFLILVGQPGAQTVLQTFAAKPVVHPDVIVFDASAISPAPQAGWTYDGTTFAAPVVPVPTAAELAAYAERFQAALRDGGIKVNVGTASAPQIVDVASDVTGRGLVSGCVQLSGLASQTGQAAPSFPWVNNDGTTVTLTSAQMMTIGYTLGAFVQATYSTLGTVLAAIANGTLTTTAGIDTASWPATSA